jgi:hypothetical protein
MRHALFFLAALMSTASFARSTDSPDWPQGVGNPKELTEPVKLVAADIIMNGSDSVCGKLRGANGKEFWFYLERGPWAFEPHREEGLYVGYMSGHIPGTARARFAGWTEADFCLLLEGTISSEFRWDSESGRLVPTDKSAFDHRLQMETLGRSAARKLLRYTESVLRRKQSYMGANRPNQSLEPTAGRREVHIDPMK